MKIDYWQNLEERQVYHIYNRSVGEANLFLSDDNFQFFLKKWKKYIQPYMDTFAYCLMPNHFHFLAQVKPLNKDTLQFVQKEETIAASKLINQEISYNTFLEDQFKRLFSSYSLAFNKRHERRGTLFQKRFKRIKVQGVANIIDKFLYIHHNPIHHDFTVRYDEWKYSSYEAYFSDKSTKLAKATMMQLLIGQQKENQQDILDKIHQEYKTRRRNQILDEDDFS